MLRKVYDPLLARLFGALWMVGFVIFETMAIVAFRRFGSTSTSIFLAIPAVVLFVLALWTFWRNPWALAIGTLLSAAQIVGVAGCIHDLATGTSRMAASLLSLGIDPTAGLIAHLVYSLAGSALFVWALIRFVRIKANDGASSARK
jgi:hypothetical protein